MADSDCIPPCYQANVLVDDDFIYEDEEEEEPDVDVENGYYNAKGTGQWLSLVSNIQPSKRTIQKKLSMNSASSSKLSPQQVKRAIGK